jgi:hypothetical protein
MMAEAACTGGVARALTETLPWHLQYLGFTGILPRIQDLRLIWVKSSASIRESEGLTCLVGTEAAHPGASLLNVEAAGTVRTVRNDERASIPLGGGFLCEAAEPATEAGTGEVFAGATGTTRVIERLVQ